MGKTKSKKKASVFEKFVSSEIYLNYHLFKIRIINISVNSILFKYTYILMQTFYINNTLHVTGYRISMLSKSSRYLEEELKASATPR